MGDRGKRASSMAKSLHSSKRAGNYRKQNAMWASNGTNPSLSYEQIQDLMKRRLKLRETTTEEEIKEALEDFRSEREGLFTVDTELLNQQDLAAASYLRKRVVPTIGYVSQSRRPGTWRWLFGNINNIATSKCRSLKADQLKSLIEEYDISGFGFCEVGIDTRCLKPSESLHRMLHLDNTVKFSYAHNRSAPKMGIAQRGGCLVAAREELSSFVKGTTNDFRHIGRWTSMVLSSHPDQRLRVVVAYNVGKSKPQGLRTFYQQTLSAMQKEQLPGNPRKLMRDDFLNQLKTWLRQGDRIILSMDANEHVLDGPLCSQLADIGFSPWGHRMHGTLPNTHAEGSECIDEVWGSYGLECTALQVLSFHKCIGDHRMFLVDFTMRSAVGLYAHLIVRPECRRLVTSNKACANRYRALVEEQWRYHTASTKG